MNFKVGKKIHITSNTRSVPENGREEGEEEGSTLVWTTGKARRSGDLISSIGEERVRRNMAKTCAEIQPHPFFKSEMGHHRRVAVVVCARISLAIESAWWGGNHYYPPSPSGTLGTPGVVNYFLTNTITIDHPLLAPGTLQA